ncbi:hypothetical protein GKR67_19475 [Providencia alcalifaciens]|uniref:DUF1311 domain-containing protein n=1 Tax=Providencia alcalifaciens TaxID=126385 RepID=A0AAW9VFN8_9GAMM|nr:hypothetical protein [Providencia alcalifaciens]
MPNYAFTVGIHMFKKVIVVFFLIFSAHLGFATDLSFKENSPIDRLYNESYQGIEQLREEQKFKFDPKLKIAQKDRSYQSLLEQRDEDEKSILNHIRPCDINPSAVGCPGHLSWMDNPREFQSMLEQKYKNE